MTGKKFRFSHDRNTLGLSVSDRDMSFSYDNEGHVTNDNGVAIGYDSMGRPNTGLSVTGVTYGPADEALLIGQWGEFNGVVEQRTYNSLGQLTMQKGVPYPYATEAYKFTYTYNDGTNNGQLYKFRDDITTEEVKYSYDSVRRLTSAETTGPEWGRTLPVSGPELHLRWIR